MRLFLEVVDRLGRNQPFRVSVPKTELTGLLSGLAAARGQLPDIAIWIPPHGADWAWVDFAAPNGEWELQSAEHR